MSEPLPADNSLTIGVPRGNLKGEFMGSFKLKLVGALLVLSLLPLAVVYSSFSSAADRSITSAVDGQLEASARAVVAAYEAELRGAQEEAERLAENPRLQVAVARRDRRELQRLLRPHPTLRLETQDGFVVGRAPGRAADVPVSLVGAGPRAARLIAAVALDGELLRRLHAAAGLRPFERLGLVTPGGSLVAASADDLRGTLPVEPGDIATAPVGGSRYRIASVRLAADPTVFLALAIPWSSVAEQQRAERTRLFGAIAVALLLIAVVAYSIGRSIVRSLGRLATAANSIAAGQLRERVPVRGRDELAALSSAFNRMAAELEVRVHELEDERRRLREANHRFGEALVSTLDPEELRRVIVETAVEATHADGGLLRDGDGAVVTAGNPDAEGNRIEFPLTVGPGSSGSLVLVGRRFDADATRTAAELAGQAVVALENARLHRVVERQAHVDELTGLANRRQAEESLDEELARAARLGGTVGFILADLDDFKQINDRHGHPTGDAVLAAFAETLRHATREIDLPARWGGEEFAIVLPGTDLDGAKEAAERMRAELTAMRVSGPDGELIAMTASFGAASAAAGVSRNELVEQADGALYRAKRLGKDRVCAATNGLDEVEQQLPSV
jgi:diguanylate cyclase (GGDEF)-like protein